MEKTLLEQAKKIKTKSKPRIEWDKFEGLEELAIAWAKKEVAYIQVVKAIFPDENIKNASTKSYYALAMGFKKAIEKGKLVENFKKTYENNNR